MSASRPDAPLRSRLAAASPDAHARLSGREASAGLAELATASRLGERAAELAGRSVLVRARTQLGAALAMAELDGVAARLILCPPDLADEHLPHVVAQGAVEAVVSDGPDDGLTPGLPHVRLDPTAPASTPVPATQPLPTEWVLFTSGTTGAPKMVAHTLEGLSGAIAPRAANAPGPVWGTFYDIRRYGGLQILLRALLGGATLVLSDAGEPVAEHLARLGEAGVTHLSGTPSHWRRALMSPALRLIDPAYVRLSGEVADQALLDSLAAAFPRAAVGHAYASTEAGVGFEVTDGREGFPAAWLDRVDGPVAMKLEDGSLRLRSGRAASRYVGDGGAALAEADGYVDSGDMIELRGDRCHFVGRRTGVINVGGLKIHPEEVEAAINRHPAVRASLVRGRRSPITGALVTADVVLSDDADRSAELGPAILDHCRARLAPFKVPVSIRFVEALAMTPGGKLERRAA